MGKALTSSPMAISSQEVTLRVDQKAKVLTSGLMGHPTPVTSSMGRSRDTASGRKIKSLMVITILVNSSKI
jgi:hypothetical protein